MKKGIIMGLLISLGFTTGLIAQESRVGFPEHYGKTLNLGAGLAYSGYLGVPMPVIHADMEFDVARDFTLAPSVSFYTYSRKYYWGNTVYPYKDYRYHETVVPIGMKASYYFDEWLRLPAKWDLYVGTTAGFVLVSSGWDSDYYGSKDVYGGPNPIFVQMHAGAEYNLTRMAGVFLDLSTGTSTIGFGFHF